MTSVLRKKIGRNQIVSLKLVGIRFLLISTLGILFFPHTSVFAHSTDINLSGFGAATIDGQLSTGEWDFADILNFNAVIPQSLGGGTAPGTMYVMNDLTNLYLAVEFSFVASRGSAAFEFDNNDSGGERESGDDAILINSQVGFFDDVRILSSSGALFGLKDENVGGTTDGTGVFSDASGSSFYEFSHPLDSPDDAHDFSLKPGDTVAFNLFIRMIDDRPGYSFPQNTGDTDLFGGVRNSNSWGHIHIANSPQPIPEPSTAYLFGAGLAGFVAAWQYRKKQIP